MELISNRVTYRVEMVSANTEYSQAVTGEPCFLTISVETLNATFRFSFTAQTVGQESTTGSAIGKPVFQGGEWDSKGFITVSDKTIYFRSPQAGTIAFIEEFKRR